MSEADQPGGLPRASTQGGRRRFRAGSPRAWAMALDALAVLSFAVMIPLALLSHQESNGVIAAVIGVPCAAVGTTRSTATA